MSLNKSKFLLVTLSFPPHCSQCPGNWMPILPKTGQDFFGESDQCEKKGLKIPFPCGTAQLDHPEEKATASKPLSYPKTFRRASWSPILFSGQPQTTREGERRGSAPQSFRGPGSFQLVALPFSGPSESSQLCW